MTSDPAPSRPQDPVHLPGRDGEAAASRPEPRGMPAEVQYLIIVLALFALLLVSGVPGGDVPEAGDGTGVLRQGWAERWTAEVAALEAAEQDADADAADVAPR